MASTKLAYSASAAVTLTAASLSSSASLVAGRQSAAIVNTTELALDYLIAAKFRTGTTPTAGVIELWAIAAEDDTPNWPDGFGATDADRSVTSRDILAGYGKLVGAVVTDTTSDRDYWIGAVSLAAMFGGSLPKRVALWLVHNTGVNLNGTGSNHRVSATPVYSTTT